VQVLVRGGSRFRKLTVRDNLKYFLQTICRYSLRSPKSSTFLIKRRWIEGTTNSFRLFVSLLKRT
jgi:hypothetical protein